jgi:hypothetical protein
MPEETGFAFRRRRGFLCLNLSFDELVKLPSFIIHWLPGAVLSGLREPGHDSLKADSHTPCRSHAFPLPFLCCDPATTLPFSDSAVFFVLSPSSSYLLLNLIIIFVL